MYRRKVYVFGTKPNAEGKFCVAVGNHMERWTLEQCRTAWDRGLELTQADTWRYRLPVPAHAV